MSPAWPTDRRSPPVSSLTGPSAGKACALVVTPDAVLIHEGARPAASAIRRRAAGLRSGAEQRKPNAAVITISSAFSLRGSHCRYFGAFLSCLPLLVLIFVGRQRRRLRRRIVGTKVHQLPQRRNDILFRIALRLIHVQIPHVGGVRRLRPSARSRGVRLSLLTASSFPPAAASARIIATCSSCTAWWSGVEPSAALALGSAPAARSNCRASTDRGCRARGSRRTNAGEAGASRDWSAQATLMAAISGASCRRSDSGGRQVFRPWV